MNTEKINIRSNTKPNTNVIYNTKPNTNVIKITRIIYWVYVIIFTIFVIGTFVLIALSIYYLTLKDVHTKRTTGKIVESSCEFKKDKCNITIKYNVNNKEYIKNTVSKYVRYNKEDPITIFYNPDNPDNFSLNSGKRKIGMIFLPIGIVFFILSVFFYFNMKKFVFVFV